MSASRVSFIVPNARLAAFGSKDEYLAYKSAWKALTRDRAPLPASFYAAHALLTGRDLYMAFSASKRPHDKNQPYGALARALSLITTAHGRDRLVSNHCPVSLSDKQRRSISSALFRAIELLHPLRLSRGSSGYKAVACGVECASDTAGLIKTRATEDSACVSAAEALTTTVRNALAAIKRADEVCWAAKAEAERARNTAKASSEEMLATLKTAHQGRALELAIEAGQCPYATTGAHMSPHDITVCEEGLELSWDISGDYAPQTFFASWDDLLGFVEARKEASA